MLIQHDAAYDQASIEATLAGSLFTNSPNAPPGWLAAVAEASLEKARMA